MSDAQGPASYRVALVQMAMSRDPDQNLRAAVARVGEAAAAAYRG